jgi:phospholipid N-methyltransferase
MGKTFREISIINSRIDVNSLFRPRPGPPLGPVAGLFSGLGHSSLDNSSLEGDYSKPMSVLFFKRFLQRPFQIASIVPSSKALVERVAEKIDFSRARVIAEYGPGVGVHSREIARRMRPDCQLLLFELDPAFSRDLERQFASDTRVHVINDDALRLSRQLRHRRIEACDYIVSGIPFSILKIDKKRALLQKTYKALVPGGRFIIYQVTNELRQHAKIFERAKSEYFLQNIPPMFITVFEKTNERNGEHALPEDGRLRAIYRA